MHWQNTSLNQRVGSSITHISNFYTPNKRVYTVHATLRDDNASCPWKPASHNKRGSPGFLQRNPYRYSTRLSSLSRRGDRSLVWHETNDLLRQSACCSLSLTRNILGRLYLYSGTQLTPSKSLRLPILLLIHKWTLLHNFCRFWRSSDRTRVLISWPCDYHFQRLRQMSSFLVVGTIVSERKVGQPASQWW